MENSAIQFGFIFLLALCHNFNNVVPQLLSECVEGMSDEICRNAEESKRGHLKAMLPVKIFDVNGNGSEPEQMLTEEEAQIFLQKINDEDSVDSNLNNKIRWNFQTNITDHNKRLLSEDMVRRVKFYKDIWNRVQVWKSVWPTFKNESVKRQFKFRSILGANALPEQKFEKMNGIVLNMGEIYSKGKICDYFNSSKCNLALEPEIVNIMRSSRNYDELKHTWKAWRDAVGRPTRCQFAEMVELLNEAATYNGFETTVDLWLFDYESDSFEDDIERIYRQLHPLYKELHAYTRRKLREFYGDDKISKDGPIPAHVTGNMWAQSWESIYDILVPFPNKKSIDVSDTMVEKGYTPKIMFEMADDFFASLGLERVPDSFWNNSVLEKPFGRDLQCHASAWDFADAKDFRIKQCTRVNMEDFSTVHHELGHVQYYLQYKHLPYIFRKAANPGFHEAIGDIMDLSVSTPKHLNKIGLLTTYEIDDEADINFLLQTALRKVAFLPFGYLIDKYRWDIFRGHVTPQNYTKAWWKYRYEYQGIEPPIERTELDFDPAAKKHVSSNTRYIRYFVAHILQFQFHKAVCLLAKEYDPNDTTKPLHRCDIYQSKEAGKALKEMMSLGRSKHWREPLRKLTGFEEIDASALREYFLPLENWLKANNKEHGEHVGWGGYETWLRKNEDIKNNIQTSDNNQTSVNDQSQNLTTDSEVLANATILPTVQIQTDEDAFSEANGQLFMKNYNDERAKIYNEHTKALWNYETNITEHTKQIYDQLQVSHGAVLKAQKEKLQEWKSFWPKFQNETLKRQFKLYSVGDPSALPKDKYDELNKIDLTLTEIYGKAKICDYNNTIKCDLSLRPDLVNILKRSRNVDELEHVWKAWRSSAGKPTRCLFTRRKQLLNEAATLNGFPSNAEMSIENYESETFEEEIQNLYSQLKPLYLQIHSYTRRNLREVYGESIISRKGAIPVHLTGNMWTQSWENIFELMVPYPNKTNINVTEALISQRFTPELMYRYGDDFFVSMGLERVPESFWKKSIFGKPTDGRELVCHANAFNFHDGKDFRIKQCAQVTMKDLLVAYHQLGHIQYFLQYKHLPLVFRDGANDGFHEAVGDLIGLSVLTPKYLQKIGLIYSYTDDYETDINYLLKRSLEKIVFLPYAYLLDKYRWDIYKGIITPHNYTKAWWDYRLKFQGVNPPVPRTEFDFDPGAKYHVSANVGFIRYFVSHILQFQLHKNLCLVAKEYVPNDPEKPLFKCNLYQSVEAGSALKQILQVGRSRHWRETLKSLTGSNKLDASAILEYFHPLIEWLRINNEKHGEFIGWE